LKLPAYVKCISPLSAAKYLTNFVAFFAAAAAKNATTALFIA
jgi:hypothetical protein